MCGAPERRTAGGVEKSPVAMASSSSNSNARVLSVEYCEVCSCMHASAMLSMLVTATGCEPFPGREGGVHVPSKWYHLVLLEALWGRAK